MGKIDKRGFHDVKQIDLKQKSRGLGEVYDAALRDNASDGTSNDRGTPTFSAENMRWYERTPRQDVSVNVAREYGKERRQQHDTYRKSVDGEDTRANVQREKNV